MTIKFTVYRDAGYLLAEYGSDLTDVSLTADWRAYLESEQAVLGLHELIDLSAADFSQVTSAGIEALTRFIGEYYAEHGSGTPTRTSIYAPEDLPFGMSRMYASLARESSETVSVFRDRSEALRWIGVEV